MSSSEEGSREGYELPLLLAGAFRTVADALYRELTEAGHPDARPVHGFALQAIGPGAVTAAELGRRLGVSKQAAAKTAAALERLGYVTREANLEDGRTTLLARTAHGRELLTLSAEILGRLRAEWMQILGEGRLDQLEEDLSLIAGSGNRAKLGDFPGWLR